MSESPRWERESQEDLGVPESSEHLVAPASPQADETIEFDLAAAGLADPDDPSDATELAREPRLAAARESARETFAATRESARETLAGIRVSARESLSAGRASARESLTATRETVAGATESLAGTAGRVGRWFAALDRRPEFELEGGRDPIAELTAGPACEGSADSDEDPRDERDLADFSEADGTRFPLARRGYDRASVDAHLVALEAELTQLRDDAAPPMSINEEIERLGEQTASILVVAHDKAHETTRVAHAQAAREVKDAARDAERITAEAQRRLRELDAETDAVWRERERLLDDVRDVAATLATLADAASERFPADEPASVPAPVADSDEAPDAATAAAAETPVTAG